MKYPNNVRDFMLWFKTQSEEYFATIEIEKEAAGSQHQQGTKWKPGLTTQELIDFQNDLGFQFPEELIEFYKLMNGTMMPGVNIYSNQGLPYTYTPNYFSYPEHLPLIKKLIQKRLDVNSLTIQKMKEHKIPFIFPVADFYFIVIDYITNPIYYLSIGRKNMDINQPYAYGQLWTDTFQSWLIKHTFYQTTHISDPEEFPDKQRVPNYWTT